MFMNTTPGVQLIALRKQFTQRVDSLFVGATDAVTDVFALDGGYCARASVTGHFRSVVFMARASDCTSDPADAMDRTIELLVSEYNRRREEAIDEKIFALRKRAAELDVEARALRDEASAISDETLQ